MRLVAMPPILVEQVYERLRDAIASCEIAPGQRIRQAELADSLGVSRQPVSHALQLLRRDGLVEDCGRKGLQVAPLDPGHLGELYQMRGTLDALAARLAAERIAREEATPAEIAALERIVADADAFDDATPIAARIAHDIAFHDQLIAMSGNRHIATALAPLFAHIRRSMKLVLDDGSVRVGARDDHREIARHVLAGHADAAANAAATHATRAGSETERRLRAELDAQRSA